MKTEHNVRLTSLEIAALWTTYINDTMARCVLKYFLHKVEDAQIQPVLELALHITEKHIRQLADLFQSEDYAVPLGFTDHDVNIHAKRLFSDSFFLHYVKNMGKVGIATYGIAYALSSRSDVRSFFREATNQTLELDERATEILLQKGVYVRPPSISNADSIDFVKRQDFLSGGGFFGLGEKRPLLAVEIGQLFANIQTNVLGKALLMGFSQVVSSNEVREYLLRGKDISVKHIKIFSNTLVDEDLPAPMTWDPDVMDSTEAPFSDKLMLFHVSLLVAAGSGNYGVSATASPRMDLATNYVRLAAEIASYALDGAKLMISNGWLEEPPQAPNRKQLAQQT